MESSLYGQLAYTGRRVRVGIGKALPGSLAVFFIAASDMHCYSWPPIAAHIVLPFIVG